MQTRVFNLSFADVQARAVHHRSRHALPMPWHALGTSFAPLSPAAAPATVPPTIAQPRLTSPMHPRACSRTARVCLAWRLWTCPRAAAPSVATVLSPRTAPPQGNRVAVSGSCNGWMATARVQAVCSTHSQLETMQSGRVLGLLPAMAGMLQRSQLPVRSGRRWSWAVTVVPSCQAPRRCKGVLRTFGQGGRYCASSLWL